MNSITYYWHLVLLVFFLKNAYSERIILSECHFIDEYEQNCKWNNFENYLCKWQLSHLDKEKINDQSLITNRSYLILKSVENKLSINSMYESDSMSQNSSGICFTLRFIMSSNCSDCRIRIFAIINQSHIEFLNEYQQKNSEHNWNEAQTYLPLRYSDEFKINILGYINSLDEQFIAVDYISIESGYCHETNSIIELSGTLHNNTLNSSFVDPSKERIGTRITFWIVLAASLLILSVSTFAFIGIIKCKNEHKRRLARSKRSHVNQLTELPTDDFVEDLIFEEDFKVMPRGGSFIRNIIRQISSKSLKSNG